MLLICYPEALFKIDNKDVDKFQHTNNSASSFLRYFQNYRVNNAVKRSGNLSATAMLKQSVDVCAITHYWYGEYCDLKELSCLVIPIVNPCLLRCRLNVKKNFVQLLDDETNMNTTSFSLVG